MNACQERWWIALQERLLDGSSSKITKGSPVSCQHYIQGIISFLAMTDKSNPVWQSKMGTMDLHNVKIYDH
jgi:hypothetical protein